MHGFMHILLAGGPVVEKFPVTFWHPFPANRAAGGTGTFFCAIAPIHNPAGVPAVYSFGSDNQPDFSRDENGQTSAQTSSRLL